MAVKNEIGWTTETEDGTKRLVNVEKHGKEWRFFERLKRRGPEVQWLPVAQPPLQDWLDLLDALERRYQRDMAPPEQVEQVRRTIRERFPEHQR